MCSSRKYPYPPHGRLMEIPGVGGFQKPNFLNESMTLKGNFRRGGGFNLKNLPRIFSGTTQFRIFSSQQSNPPTVQAEHFLSVQMLCTK